MIDKFCLIVYYMYKLAAANHIMSIGGVKDEPKGSGNRC